MNPLPNTNHGFWDSEKELIQTSLQYTPKKIFLLFFTLPPFSLFDRLSFENGSNVMWCWYALTYLWYKYTQQKSRIDRLWVLFVVATWMALDEKKIMKYSALKTTLQYKPKRKVNKYKVDLIMACIMVYNNILTKANQ